MTEREDRWRDDFETVEIPPGPQPKPSQGKSKAKPNGHTAEEANAQKTPILDRTAPYKSAAVFLQHHYGHKDGRTLHRHRGSFHVYTNTHYREMQAEEIRRILYQFLDRAKVWQTGKKTKGEEPSSELASFKPNRNDVNDIVDTVTARAGIDDHLTMPCWLGEEPGPSDVIPLQNGLLDPATRELHPHSPRYFQSYSLPFDYNPQAPEPAAWLRFLKSIWPDDPDAIDTLQEIMGLLLTADTSHQKLFLMVGPARSGKGTIGRVIQGLLGKENVAGPTLSGLAQNFGMQTLIGKPVGIISDARLSGRSDSAVISERLLSISGEDVQTIDRKHRDHWTGTLPTRMLILTNRLPKIDDASGALATRFVILIMTKSFLGKEDHALTNAVLGELGGIFNWALTGRDRLAQRGRFVMPASSAEAVEQMTVLTSSTIAFVRDMCVLAPAAWIKVTALYEGWRTWCKQQGQDRPGSKNTFGVNLHAALPELKVRRPREEADRSREYVGIRLRTEDDPPP